MHIYGLIIGIAIVVAISVATKVYRRLGGDEEEIARLSYWVVVGGIVSARLYHVVDYWDYYNINLVEVFALWNGGLSIWGGLVGGGAVLWWLIRDREKLWEILASCAVAMPLSQAIGRVANGANGEFAELVYLLPWWSVEMVANLGLFGVMYFVLLRGRTSRWIVGTYLVGYGTLRGLLEGYRSDSYWMSYVFASIAVIIGLWLIKNAPDSSAISKGERM